MIEQIENLPANVVGFRSMGAITEQDFTGTIIPKIKQLIEKTDVLNCLLVLDTPVKNFTMGSMIRNALMDLKLIAKWDRAAIVSDIDSIRTFTDLFNTVVPGQFRGFKQADMDAAIQWASGI